MLSKMDYTAIIVAIIVAVSSLLVAWKTSRTAATKAELEDTIRLLRECETRCKMAIEEKIAVMMQLIKSLGREDGREDAE